MKISMCSLIISLFTMIIMSYPVYSFTSGSGTEVDPYQISTLSDLLLLADSVNNISSWSFNKYFELTADVPGFNGVIGINPTHAFLGNFEGSNHTVTLQINRPTDTYVGMFGCVVGATIKHLIVNGSVNGRSQVGGIAGRCNAYTEIIYCKNYAEITIINVNGDYVGGICGKIANSTIEHCENSGAINSIGLFGVGGIAGAIDSNAVISLCLNFGEITGKACVGGIVGDQYNGTVTKCGNVGRVLINDIYTTFRGGIGGIVGEITKGSITLCTNVGSVISDTDVYGGGIVGKEGKADSDTILDCVNSGMTLFKLNNSGITSSPFAKVERCLVTAGGDFSNNIKPGNSTDCVIDRKMSLTTLTDIQTSALCGNALQSILLSSYVYQANLYPRLNVGLNNDSINKLAAAPVFFSQTASPSYDCAMQVQYVFSVSTANGVEWSSTRGNVEFSGNLAFPVDDNATDTLIATLGRYQKKIPIQISKLIPNHIVRVITIVDGIAVAVDSTSTPLVTSVLVNWDLVYQFDDSCHIFQGWFNDRDSLISSTVGNIIASLTADTTILYAKWISTGNYGTVHFINYQSGIFNVAPFLSQTTSFCLDTNYICIAKSNYFPGVDSCWEFGEWRFTNGNIISTDINYIFTFGGVWEIYGCFYPRDSYLNISSGEGGTATGGGCEFPQTITATADNCYTFLEWRNIDNNVRVSTDSIYVVNLVGQGAKNYKAIFVQNPVIVVGSNGGGSVYVSTFDETVVGCCKTYCNNSIYATGIPDSCYQFLHWIVDETGEIYSTNVSVAISEPVSIRAVFVKIKGNIVTLWSNPTWGGTVHGGSDYDCEQKVPLEAQPADCYRFVKWTNDAGVTISTDQYYTFYMYTSNLNLTAHFEWDTVNITVRAIPSNAGTVSGNGRYTCGDEAGISTTNTNSCYSFLYWVNEVTGEIISEQQSCKILMSKNINLAAIYENDSLDLELSFLPEESGVVNTSGKYACNQYVTIEAIPNDCYRFVSWIETETSREISKNASYSFTMKDSSRHYTALFDFDTARLTLSVSPSKSGTVTHEGPTFRCGDSTVITATAADCYHFVNWTNSQTGEVVSTDRNATILMNGNRTLIANFINDSLDLNLVSLPIDAAIFTGNGKHICSDKVTYIAEPNGCWDFVCWLNENEDTVSVNTVNTLTIRRDTTLIAVFVPKETSTLRLSANIPGSGTLQQGNLDGNYPCGTRVMITAIPNECYRFINWTDSITGDEVSDRSNFPIMLSQDRVLIANFEMIDYSLSLRPNPSYAGGVAYDGVYHCGEVAKLKAYPNSCYHFINWTDSITGIKISDNEVDSILINRGRTIICNFARDTYKLELRTNPPDGIVLQSGSGEYDCGYEVTISAGEKDCWQFTCWTNLKGDTISRNRNEYATIMHDTVIVAHFVTDPFKLTLRAEPTIGGKVNGADMWSYNFKCDDKTSIVADANDGYIFLYWTDDADGSVYSVYDMETIMIKRNTSLTAHFDINGDVDTFNLTLYANPTTGGTVATSGRYPSKSAIKVTAVANPGYRFINWTSDWPTGAVRSNDSVFYVVINCDTTLYANFADSSKKTVTLLSYPTGIGASLIGGGAYDVLDTASISAKTPSGYRFVNWTNRNNGQIVSIDADFPLIVIHDTAIIANFSRQSCLLMVDANPYFMGYITGTTSGLYNFYHHAIMTAHSNDTANYEFVNWTTANNKTLSTDTTFEFDILTDTAIIANFRYKTGIDEINANNIFAVYPNPVSDMLYVDIYSDAVQNIRIILSDLLGREVIQVYEGVIDSGIFKGSIDTYQLTQGTYFLKMTIGSVFKVEKIIVK